MVECKNCRHFRKLPGGTVWKRKTGCYHPDNMEQKQADGFLAEQEVPGDHEKINLRGDCAQYEPKPRTASFIRRVARMMRA